MKLSGRFGKTLLFSALAVLVFLLIGSAYSVPAPTGPDERIQAAVALGAELAAGDRVEWNAVAASQPLWLIELNSR